MALKGWDERHFRNLTRMLSRQIFNWQNMVGAVDTWQSAGQYIEESFGNRENMALYIAGCGTV